jgi:two-component system response regulator
VNKKTILFIEDDKDDLAFSMKAFKENKAFFNYLIMAYDGMQAEKYLTIDSNLEFKEMSLKPDLIILDLKLPFLSGLEILKKIRENKFTKNIPVVVFTSSDNPEDLIESYYLGANSFVKKPISYEKFIETLKKVIYYWLEINMNISV